MQPVSFLRLLKNGGTRKNHKYADFLAWVLQIIDMNSFFIGLVLGFEVGRVLCPASFLLNKPFRSFEITKLLSNFAALFRTGHKTFN